MIRNLTAFLVALVLAGCATDITQVAKPGMTLDEVVARAGKPVVQGDSYWDYSRQPWGYYRVDFGPDKRVRAVRDLHTEENFRRLKPGMTEQEVAETVGVTSWVEGYASGTSWRYRYRDAGIAKLLHVVFDDSKKVAWYYWEWDPDVYSKGGPTGDRM
jgi:outer membrane protein assembly factor BamE (lipoprotein component of BamABCDE complex)